MWVCSKCEQENSDNQSKCRICETEKPQGSVSQESIRVSTDKTFQDKNNLQSPSKSPEQLSHNEFAATAMVLGIVSLVLSWLPIIGLVLAIVGLIISRSNRRFAEAHSFKENNMNTAGFVTSWVGLIMGIITILIIVTYLIFITSDISHYTVLPEIM